MKLFLLISFLIFPVFTMAQDEVADTISECAAVLASPPFVDILTRNDGNDFHELSPRKSGRALLGLECSVDQLTVFFENAGWEFLGFEKWRNLSEPVSARGRNPEYYVDASANFCQKRPTIFGIFGYRCRPIATIAFHDGLISTLIVHMSK